MRAQITYPSVYGISLIVIGLGSAFYHASLTFVGQVLDVQGMYFLIAFAAVYSSSRIKPISPRMFVGVYVLLCLILLALQLWLPDVRRIVFALLVVAVLAIETRIQVKTRSADSRYIIAGMICLAVGFGIWYLDQSKILCAPDSPIQGHAIWHILSAASAGLLYLYYRSERAKSTSAAPTG
jgi:predicted membrane channel-forming protein YqfA (hemolysin III family)